MVLVLEEPTKAGEQTGFSHAVRHEQRRRSHDALSDGFVMSVALSEAAPPSCDRAQSLEVR
jgi:hypothetical protein